MFGPKAGAFGTPTQAAAPTVGFNFGAPQTVAGAFGTPAPAAALPSFNFGATQTAAGVAGAAPAAAPTVGFNFGAPQAAAGAAPAAPTAGGFNFGASQAATGAFGAPATAAPTVGFNFGAPQAAAAGAPVAGGFNFGAAAAPAAAPVAGGFNFGAAAAPAAAPVAGGFNFGAPGALGTATAASDIAPGQMWCPVGVTSRQCIFSDLKDGVPDLLAFKKALEDASRKQQQEQVKAVSKMKVSFPVQEGIKKILRQVGDALRQQEKLKVDQAGLLAEIKETLRKARTKNENIKAQGLTEDTEDTEDPLGLANLERRCSDYEAEVVNLKRLSAVRHHNCSESTAHFYPCLEGDYSGPLALSPLEVAEVVVGLNQHVAGLADRIARLHDRVDTLRARKRDTGCDPFLEMDLEEERQRRLLEYQSQPKNDLQVNGGGGGGVNLAAGTNAAAKPAAGGFNFGFPAAPAAPPAAGGFNFCAPAVTGATPAAGGFALAAPGAPAATPAAGGFAFASSGAPAATGGGFNFSPSAPIANSGGAAEAKTPFGLSSKPKKYGLKSTGP